MNMCKRRFAARVLALLASLSGAAGTAVAAPSFAVAVHFSPPERSALLVRAMTQEASAIWAPYGVEFVWSADRNDGDPAGIDGSFGVVIQRRRQREHGSSGDAVLGLTQLPSGSIVRAPIVIDRDAVEQTLDSLHSDRVLAITGRQSLASPEIGRALGRVLAHEIGHVLLAQRAHQTQGLMRASYAADDLAALRRDSFTLSANEIERLRARCEALRNSIDAPTGPPNATPARNEPEESKIGRHEDRRSGFVWGATQSAP
jgi:hypothetical protein